MKIKLVTLLFPIVLMLSGCVVYHPQTVDIPLISKKGDLRVDAGVSVIPTAHTTISYGATDKIAVQGFASVGSPVEHYLQGGAGRYWSFENYKVIELYGGVGHGYGDAYVGSNPGNLVGDYQLYFTQFNYGKIASETSNTELGIGLKAGYLHSSLVDKNYYGLPSEQDIPTLYKDESILLEPAAVLRVGGDHWRFSLKLGSTWMYKFTHKDKRLPFKRFNMGLGINYRL